MKHVKGCDIPGMRELKMGKSKVFLLGTVKGLVSEGERVKEAVAAVSPGVIGLHIHKNELKGLGAVVRGEVKETGLSCTEETYGRNLAMFGEVQVPPPSLVAAYRIARESKIPLAPLDMGDGQFADEFTRKISTITLIRQSFRMRRLKKKRFQCADADNFVMEWDSIVNGLRGYRELERERERHMAENIGLLAREHKRVLAVLETERLDGIMGFLKG